MLIISPSFSLPGRALSGSPCSRAGPACLCILFYLCWDSKKKPILRSYYLIYPIIHLTDVFSTSESSVQCLGCLEEPLSCQLICWVLSNFHFTLGPWGAFFPSPFILTNASLWTIHPHNFSMLFTQDFFFVVLLKFPTVSYKCSYLFCPNFSLSWNVLGLAKVPCLNCDYSLLFATPTYSERWKENRNGVYTVSNRMKKYVFVLFSLTLALLPFLSASSHPLMLLCHSLSEIFSKRI